MANEVRIRTSVSGAKQATGEVRSLQDAYTRLQKQGAKGFMVGVGASATTAAFNAIGGAIRGVGDFMGTALERASDLDESMSKVNVVFGAGARAVEKWAEGAAEAFGQSKQQALEAAGTYGNLFQAFGIGQEKAQQMSMTLVELAADLASFNNTSIDDALVALRSGLSGETEPLKRYGIALSDARMRQELMAQGVKDLGATLTPLQKSQAAYTLILKDSTLAQGDFQRTADQTANVIRSNEAAIADLEAEIGQKALPAQKAWLDLQKDTFSVLGGGLTAIDETADAYERYEGSLDVLGATMLGNIPIIQDWIDGQHDAVDAIQLVKDGADEGRDGFVAWRREANNAGDASGDLASDLKELEDQAKETEREIGDLADTIGEDLFGDAINAGNEARLKEQIKDLRKQREEVKKGSPEWLELTGEIAENQDALFDLQLQMKQKEGPRAVIDWLKDQKRLFGDTTGAIQRLIDEYEKLLRKAGRLAGAPMFGGGLAYTGARPYAKGGRYKAGEPRIVGEEGPEIDIPDGSGTIIPNNKLGSSGGGSWGGTLNLNVNVTGAALTPAISTQLAREVGPAIADYLKRRGLLAA